MTVNLTKSTESSIDLAIIGSGMFLVRDNENPDKTLVTSAGHFEIDAEGNLVDENGLALLGYKYEEQNTSTTNKLVPIKLPFLKGNCPPNDNLEKIDKAGPAIIKFDNPEHQNYGLDWYKLIVIENGSSLNNGDTLTLVSSASGIHYNFTYGGIIRSNDITTSILGAYTATMVFPDAIPDSSFTISTPKSGTSTFTFNWYPANVFEGGFNSFHTLAYAMKLANGLSVGIDPSGKHLLIAPYEARDGMTIKDIKGNMAESLGLYNILPDPERFATLGGLCNLINDSEEFSGKISNFIVNSTLEISMKNPLHTFTIKGSPALLASLGLEPYHNITYGSSNNPIEKWAHISVDSLGNLMACYVSEQCETLYNIPLVMVDKPEGLIFQVGNAWEYYSELAGEIFLSASSKILELS